MSGTPLVMIVTKVVMVVMNLLSIDVVESHGWLDQEVDENQDCLLPIDYLVTKMVSMAVITMVSIKTVPLNWDQDMTPFGWPQGGTRTTSPIPGP